MENKEIKITVPEGYEIDKENSTFACIKFKKKALTYDDVAKALFERNPTFYINDRGLIIEFSEMTDCYADATNGVTEQQLERVLALNKLMNVAEYLNQGIDVFNNTYSRAYLRYNTKLREIEVAYEQSTILICGEVYFVDTRSAQQAIEILGEDTIKTALGVFE